MAAFQDSVIISHYNNVPIFLALAALQPGLNRGVGIY